MSKSRRGVLEIKMDLLENAVRHAEGVTSRCGTVRFIDENDSV